LSSTIIRDFTEEQAGRIVELYSQGWHMTEIALEFGASWAAVRRTLVARGQKIHHVGETQRLREAHAMGSDSDCDDDEIRLAPKIAEAAEKEREAWTPKEREERCVSTGAVSWEVPVVRVLIDHRNRRNLD